MTVHYSGNGVTLHHGDALDVLRTLPDASVDSVVTDPPYSIGFMGRTWDSHDSSNEDAAFAYWISGFTDGEGCFRVQRHERGSFTCTFAIKVRRDERGTLELIQRFFGGIGTIREGEGTGNAHRQATWAVQDKEGCKRLVQHFDKYPLRAKKRLDYEPWAEAVIEWHNMKRGNRWHGSADWSRMAELKARVEGARQYVDPPWSGNGFQDWTRLWAAECHRILKPGGHLLAFGATRQWHRLAAGIEDAGFEIRDSIAWLSASGFPKSLDVSKAIDKANGRQFEDRFALGRHIRERRESLGLSRATVNGWLGAATKCDHYESDSPGFARVPTLADWRILRDRLDLSDEHLALVERVEAEREIVGTGKAGKTVGSHVGEAGAYGFKSDFHVTAPATPEAERWQGWGTALKPAHEPVVVARKPLAGTVAANVTTYGTGALNIDASRIAGDVPSTTRGRNQLGSINDDGWTPSQTGERIEPHTSGRWPANVILDEEMGARLDEQSGIQRDGVATNRNRGDERPMTVEGAPRKIGSKEDVGYGGSGGASRFFFQAKAPKRERPVVDGVAHPTVKPLTLMRYLVRLVTPPGGVVLEPFGGSGTTVEACLLEGFQCVAIEKGEEYLPLILERIRRQTEGDRVADEVARVTDPEQAILEQIDGQLDIFGEATA